MRVIGITGGVGCGKSEVMRYLMEKYDCAVLKSDELAAELERKGNPCYEPVLDIFGKEVLQADGEFDRRKIAARVFRDENLLQKLNAVIHPIVVSEIHSRFAEARGRGIPFFFLESALLGEEKYNEMCNELWYVYADEKIRRIRLKESRGYSDEKITRMIHNQMSEAQLRAVADFVLDNSGSFAQTEREIDAKMAEEIRRAQEQDAQ